jgi:3-hydroxyisobutyrate dehydrogenase
MIETMMDAKTHVALLGLGTMGSGMAQNLLKAGFPLAIYNRTRSKAETLGQLGTVVATTPAEAAGSAAVVIAMIADDNASRDTWLGEGGALAAMKPGTIAVECSTVSPDWIAELNEQCAHRQIELIEAPVTGSRVQAEQGQLTFLAAGNKQILDAALPVLKCMSKEVLYLGQVGCGAQLKLINNFLCGVQAASFAEAVAWIERTGLDRTAALEFLKKGAAGSGILAAMADRMTRRTYEVNFLLRLMEKDLRYARAAASREGITLTTSQCAEKLFESARLDGYGERDMSAVVEVIRKSSTR